jgi:hypothetical protein
MIRFMVVAAGLNVVLSVAYGQASDRARSTLMVLQLLMFLLIVAAGHFEARRIRRVSGNLVDQHLHSFKTPEPNRASAALGSLEEKMATYRREDLSDV